MIVGLTGGIACGKSIAAEELRSMGVRVIDCDDIARELLHPGGDAAREVEEAFGKVVFDSEGNLLRKKLARVIFGDAEARAKLEGILHPPIRERLKSEITDSNRAGEDLVIVAPLLVESRITHFVDLVIVIKSSIEEMIERICERDGVTRSEALERIDSQLPIEEKEKHADFVIENSGTIEDFRKSVRNTWRKITNERKTVYSGIKVEKK